MICCCCCVKKSQDCGTNWVQYNDIAYSIYFGFDSPNYWVNNQGLSSICFGSFRREHFEKSLKEIYLDGYSFVPNNYISPSYKEPDCQEMDVEKCFVLPSELVSTGETVSQDIIDAFYAKINSYLKAQLECFYNHNSDWGAMEDHSSESEIVFYVSGIPYRKKIFSCVRKQEFSTQWTFTEYPTGGIIIPRLDVFYSCEYAIKIYAPEKVIE